MAAATDAETASGRATVTTGRGRSVLALLALVMLCALTAPFFVDRVAHNAPTVRDGVVDYSRWGPLTAPVELRGQWRLTWRSAPAPGVTTTIQLPGEWPGLRAGGVTLPAQGAATYHLRLKGLSAGRYTLYIPRIFAATEVLVNGRPASQRGHAGLTAATTTEVVRPHEVSIETDGGDVDLALDISNFHFDSAGFGEPPVFGMAEPMNRWIALDWISSLLEVAALLLLGCYGVVVFLYRPQDRASLYSAGGCLLLLPFVGLQAHDNLLLLSLPWLDARGVMIVQYLTSTAALSFALAYTRALFPTETPRIPYWLLQGVMALRFIAYAGIGVIGDMVMMSHLSRLSSVFRVAALFYILAVVVYAVWRRREGAVVFLIGLGGFVLTLIYSDLSANTTVPRVFSIHFVPIGVLLLIFSQMVILAQRLSSAIGAEAQTNADLRRLLDVNISISSEMRLDALLRKIVQVTSTVIHADRSSLFLFDAKTGELWSSVAEGVAGREIRFPADRGLAGWVFTHGETVNLADAYADARFNPEVDAETGYRTHSVLTLPVTTRDGRRVGVMQALNRREGVGFSKDDLERMAAFAAQAAVAIENATLFSEVQAERNYNDNILRSMASGVVTLDPELRFAKLNAAASRILEAPAEGFLDADMQGWLAASGLMAEIEAVAAGGDPKTLLDADITTAKGRTASVNLSIVPLIGEHGPTGLLILIDDITEGKRQQSVMRRFMTQKVVDQVLGREDDLLFGSACRASVLFADIRNFTALSESLGPRETVEMLNEVFTELFEAVAAADGLLDKFIGDSVMAVYGVPLTSGRDPENAVDSAVSMMRMVEALNERRLARGQTTLRIGVAIATGDLVAGAIGSPKRTDYTVIGDPVNLASRLEAMTKVYQAGIVICEATARAVADVHPLRELDTIRVRGRRQPERIFEVLTDPARADSPCLAAYRKGRELLAKRRWKDAAAAFEQAAKLDPNDRPSAIMLDRARVLAGRPPARDWDGVWEAA